MDVVNAEQVRLFYHRSAIVLDCFTKARIAEEAGACAVMALERVPADIRAEGDAQLLPPLQLIYIHIYATRWCRSYGMLLHLHFCPRSQCQISILQSDPHMIKEIVDAVTIPVMAKVRIGHFVEAQVSCGKKRKNKLSYLQPDPTSYRGGLH